MTEEKYYLGGYYLTKLKPKTSGADSGTVVYTCSECINDNLISDWSYSWAADNKNIEEYRKKYLLSDTAVLSIQTWVNCAFDEGKVGWVNVFTELEAALEYRRKFFGHLPDIIVMALYFDEVERATIIDNFAPQGNLGEIGLRMMLMKEIAETDDELLLGFDYIGIEFSGYFHTFHCQNIGTDLASHFNLSLNRYGLFDRALNSKQILDYLHDEKNNFEFVPWFITKVKLVAAENLHTEGLQKIAPDSKAFGFLSGDEELYSPKDL